VHGFARLVGQRAHERGRQFAHVKLRKLARRQFEQAHRATVSAAVIVLDDVAGVDQRLQCAMRVAAGEANPRGQRIDGARRIVHVGHRLQHHQPLEQRLVHAIFS